MDQLIAVGIMAIFSGVVSGMTGASGVMIMIPFLTMFLGLPIYVAVGTSLMADVISSVPITITYQRSKNISWLPGIFLSIGALLGAQIAIKNLAVFPEEVVVFGIGIFMVGLGLRMYRDGFNTDKQEALAPFSLLPKFLQNPWGLSVVSMSAGILLGVMTGFFGAGGGMLIFLFLYYVLRISLKSAIGTAALVMIASSLSGLVGHAILGNIDWRLGIIIGIHAMIGGTLSAYLANKTHDRVLSRGMGALFIMTAVIILGIRLLE